MPIYGVVMGQGITVKPLTNTITLMTGYIEKPADALQSCSAVILLNHLSGAAGIYHFPAGSINNDAHSRAVLRKMVKEIDPTGGHIAYGTAAYTAVQRQELTLHHEQLRSFVQGISRGIGFRLTGADAITGTAWVTCNGGGFQLGGQQLDGITDLRAQAAGTYGQYSLYGADQN